MIAGHSKLTHISCEAWRQSNRLIKELYTTENSDIIGFRIGLSKGTRSYQALPVLFAFFESRKGEVMEINTTLFRKAPRFDTRMCKAEKS